MGDELFGFKFHKGSPSKKRLATHLISSYTALHTHNPKITFAQVCDDRILLCKNNTLFLQTLDEEIKEIYKEYLELGENKFKRKYF